MNNVFKVEKATSLSKFISLGKSIDYTYDKYSILQNLNNEVKIPIYNAIHDYESELKSLMVTVELSTEEYIKYRFRPRLLAYDVYNNSELYFIILALNNMIDIKEFDLKKINMLRKNDLTILNKIYLAENKYILQNRG